MARALSRVWGRHSPTSQTGKWQSKFGSPNLWPQVDTCFRGFYTTMKIPEIKQCGTFSICVAACSCSCMGRRSHRTQFLPLFCSGVCLARSLSGRGHGSQYRGRTAYELLKVRVKRKPPCKGAKGFCRKRGSAKRSGCDCTAAALYGRIPYNWLGFVGNNIIS